MDKMQMREWLATVEGAIDKKLKKWSKGSKIENGEAVQFNWQFEQTHFIIDVFWEDGQETVKLHYLGPRVHQQFTWHGLNAVTFDKIMDRVGNLAMLNAYPAFDA